MFNVEAKITNNKLPCMPLTGKHQNLPIPLIRFADNLYRNTISELTLIGTPSTIFKDSELPRLDTLAFNQTFNYDVDRTIFEKITETVRSMPLGPFSEKDDVFIFFL